MMEKLPDPPLSLSVRDCPDDMAVYSLQQLLEYGMRCKLTERETVKNLIRDDSFASEYLSFPKYRTALLRTISRS